MIIDFSFTEEDEVFDMEPLDERTDLFPVRSVDGVFADPAGNIDLSEARDRLISERVTQTFEEKQAAGELTGPKGDKGDPGYSPQKGKDYFDGISVAVEKVEESDENGGINVVTFTDGKKLNVKNGEKGGKGDRGESGVYVGSGEMPEGYNVQIDPDGDPYDFDVEELRKHNKDPEAHEDIRRMIPTDTVTSGELAEVEGKIPTDTVTYEQLQNVQKQIPTKPSDIGAQPAGDYLTSYTETDPTVPSWAKQASKPSYSASEVGADPAGTASSAVSGHNTSTSAHNDIRLLIQGLAERLNTIANSDDVDLDQMKEVVAYIKANRSLIEGITTSKINYTDIINNLTTNVTDKPLSAAQGVALKALIDGITVPTKPSDIGAQPAGNYLTSFTETDPTVPSWAKQANKPSYTAAEVGADPSGTASGAVSSHNGASNAHSALFNKKANDYSLEIYNGTGGNPKPVRFLTVGYDTCDSENGVAIKIGMVSGHGNGSSYAFLEDVIVKVNYQGGVSVDNFKYYGADAGTYDGAARQYGDIFWVADTTNKLVTFYCLMGQYARVNSIPYKRLTYSTGGTITQPTSNAVYSSGEIVWANNSEIATKSDIPAVPTKTENWTFTYEDGTTATKEVYVK